MQAVIVSIGDELTSGQTVDTNSAWLAGRLVEHGIAAVRHATVGDATAAIVEELCRACASAGVVLVTGGLGPTKDDVTRQAVAVLLGVELVEDVELLRQIEAYFAARGRPMPEPNRVQALLPRGCRALPNACGTAPGIHARHCDAEVFVLPGVPREMRAMFEGHVAPHLHDLGGGEVIARGVLWTFGAGESVIGARIADLMARGRNPLVGTTAQELVVGVRVQARGGSAAEARRMVEAVESEVRRRLGELVFGTGEETLASAVGGLLIARGRTVATAESCTGGLIAKRLTDVPGSSAYFLEGAVTYSNAAKSRMLGVPAGLIAQHGAVSEDVAAAMANGCRARSGADYALSATGIAGPSGGSAEKPVGLVCLGLAGPDGCVTSAHRLGEALSREQIRERTASIALNQLRLALLRT